MRIIDVHAHYEPRMLEAGALLEKLNARAVSRVVLIPSMNEPILESPTNLLRVARALARRTWTRPLVEAIHRRTLTPEGNVVISGKTIAIDARPDNASVAALCAQHPKRVLGWIFLNPRQNPRVLDELEQWRSSPGMVGLKLHPHWHDYRTELLTPLLRRAEELRLPVLIHLGFGARGDYRTICEAFPKLKLVAAHAGFPFFDDLWRAGKDLPNLRVDLSSPYLDEALARDVVRVMGPERCLFGTDAPYGFHEADGSYDYGEILGWVSRLPLSESKREQVLFGNAEELLDLR
jgi:uncharacterized protein